MLATLYFDLVYI